MRLSWETKGGEREVEEDGRGGAHASVSSFLLFRQSRSHRFFVLFVFVFSALFSFSIIESRINVDEVTCDLNLPPPKTKKENSRPVENLDGKFIILCLTLGSSRLEQVAHRRRRALKLRQSREKRTNEGVQRKRPRRASTRRSTSLMA